MALSFVHPLQQLAQTGEKKVRQPFKHMRNPVKIVCAPDAGLEVLFQLSLLAIGTPTKGITQDTLQPKAPGQ